MAIGFLWFYPMFLLASAVTTVLAMYTKGSNFGQAVAFIHGT